MAVMFNMLYSTKDPKSITLLQALTGKFKYLNTLKGHVCRQEAIEQHKAVSRLIEQIATKCCDLLLVETIKHNDIIEYINVLFLRSGLLKDASTSPSSTYFF